MLHSRHLAGGGVVLAFILLGPDHRLHWDEPSFLYTAAFIDTSTLLSGNFQPSGIEGFSHNRIAHLLLAKLLFSVTGPGFLGFSLLVGLYLLLLLAGLYFLFLLLQAVAGKDENLRLSVGIISVSPIFVYLAFKTLPESPAFFGAISACLGLVRFASASAASPSRIGCLVTIAMALVFTVLTKNILVLMYGSFAISVLIFLRHRFDPTRVIVGFVAGGALSLLLFAGILGLSGIALSQYLSTLTVVVSEKEPLVSTLFHCWLEAGILFFALFLAGLSPKRRELGFFITWFLLASAPIVLRLSSIEARYLLPNIPALTGLVWLTLDGLSRFSLRNRRLKSGAGGIALVLLILNCAIAQPFMSHEVHTLQLHRLLIRLEAQWDQKIVYLTPCEYSLFYYLRFMYPAKTVFSVHSPQRSHKAGPERLRQQTISLVADRIIADRSRLRPYSHLPIVYIGFKNNFSVENVKNLSEMFFPKIMATLVTENLSRMAPMDHLQTSWVWHSPRLLLDRRDQVGHYQAYQVVFDGYPD